MSRSSVAAIVPASTGSSGGEEAAAERRIAEAPARVDARPDEEAEVEIVDGLADARGPRQSRKPGLAMRRIASRPFTT